LSTHFCTFTLVKSRTLNCWQTLLLILLISGKVIAQHSEQEKLPILIAKESNEVNRINLIVRYVMIYAATRDFKHWFDEIHILSIKNNYRPGLVYSRYYEAVILADSGKYNGAIARCKNCIDGMDSTRAVQYFDYPLHNIRFFFNMADKRLEMFQYYTTKLAYYKIHGPVENTATCFHSLGLYYLSIADYDKAIGYFIRALEVYKTFDPLGALNERGVIGSAYLDWGNIDKAELYMKSFNTQNQANKGYDTDDFDMWGDLYFMKHEYSRALQCYFMQKQTIKKMETFFQANNLMKIASVHLKLGDNDSVLFYLESADNIRQKEKSGIYFANNFGDIDFIFYQYYVAVGNKKSALKSLEISFQNARLSNDVRQILGCTKELNSFLLKNGDSMRALRYLLQYNTLQDSLNSQNAQARIASFEIEQQQQAKETEIEHLQVQKKEQRNYYLFGGAFLLLIVIAVISLILYRRKRDKAQLTSDFKNQLAKAETKALRAQMNPHFIFNSLNSINNFVTDQKHEIASDYLLKFSKLIRLILDNSRSETIPLDKELETLQLYVQLESIRFENHFKYEVNIAENTSTGSIMIPPMLLQPFIENAIWHGLMQKRSKGTITVDIGKENEKFLHISITDDGIGREKAAEIKSKSATHQSHGLKVTSERIEMMNKLNSTGAQVHIIDLKDEQGNALGTRVELIIPV